MSFASASALRISETVTCAPRRRRNSAAARPDLPSPTTRTFLPFRSIDSRTQSMTDRLYRVRASSEFCACQTSPHDAR